MPTCHFSKDFLSFSNFRLYVSFITFTFFIHQTMFCFSNRGLVIRIFTTAYFLLGLGEIILADLDLAGEVPPVYLDLTELFIGSQEFLLGLGEVLLVGLDLASSLLDWERSFLLISTSLSSLLGWERSFM